MVQVSLDKVSVLCHQRGESFGSLERKLNFSPGQIKRWAIGRTDPTLGNLSKLANGLGVTINDILIGQQHAKNSLEERQISFYQELYKTYQAFKAQELDNPLQLAISSVAIGKYLDLDEHEGVMIPVWEKLLAIGKRDHDRQLKKEKQLHGAPQARIKFRS
ncbi:TPA: helix-turn-helix transcriptional regulator [Enterococcus faecium]|uniref:helix-turn-helix domain-containing protein n=1 Tax=Enterococcus faecium TaxID=1352 RepID=UPI00205F44AC|nr:helix-turn-helix transcriptional regulator [Enterococcus faecium]DAH94198.1 MAG TPA: helix-turn-helix domain protein [Caudoviricetes sp.]MCC9085024.1 helix-turn-helix domain-containing protein [Enterococcus faecium]BDP64798.1 hypothetical protein EfmJHP80_22940 [Enterococcus faecium]HAQ5324786.1 helix-turn-helix transcriptional regulator [Enterococcus faecium]HAQ5810141.1 helix-turn-helix transcriptional regulator [Enterococcus faecium]